MIRSIMAVTERSGRRRNKRFWFSDDMRPERKDIHPMTLQQLHYAITIAEVGSLNKAAEILYIAQPSLTSSMKELEKELGISIFYRSGRGVSLTNDGTEFLLYARQLYHQYEVLVEKYEGQNYKKKFGVSTQHYSFAIKAFVELVKKFDTSQYEFAIRETKTKDVIQDVSSMRSEIGILYLNDFNRATLTKIFNSNNLEFHHLISCRAYVYLWAGHPLAKKSSIRLEDLKDYPCLSFEQGDSGSFYFSEEILSTSEYARTIKACDRATMLNLMIGLNGYTLCSGIICEELNGNDYLAVPFLLDNEEKDTTMEVGYIIKKNTVLSNTGSLYIEEIRKYLTAEPDQL
jgi:DNA-binding transcriptional LysR family regulator